MRDEIMACILVGYLCNLFFGTLLFITHGKRLIELFWFLIPYSFFIFLNRSFR